MVRTCKAGGKVYFIWDGEVVKLVQYTQVDEMCLIETSNMGIRYWVFRGWLKKIPRKEGELRWHAQKL